MFDDRSYSARLSDLFYPSATCSTQMATSWCKTSIGEFTFSQRLIYILANYNTMIRRYDYNYTLSYLLYLYRDVRYTVLLNKKIPLPSDTRKEEEVSKTLRQSGKFGYA